LEKVLYLTYDGLTDPLGQSQILPYVKGLSKLGYQFTILSCDKPDRYNKLKDKIENLCKEDNIEWVSFPFSNKIPIISKIIDRFRFKKIAKVLHKKNRFQLIHCRSYISSEIGLYLKKKFGTKFLFDMRGFWADEKVDGGNWNIKNPLFKFIYKHYKYKEKSFLEYADYTISLTEIAKREIHRWKHIDNNPVKIEVIPCCVDTAHFDYNKIHIEEQHKLRKELNIADTDYVVSYLGSIGTWYMLPEMLHFFKQLLTKKPQSKFLFITGDAREEIFGLAREMDIKEANIVVKSAQRNEVPLLLSLSNLSLFFIRPTYSKISSSPTKQAEIMAMGIPIVTNSNIGDSDLLFKTVNAGFVCSDFNNYEYESAIAKVINEPYKRAVIRQYAIDYFGLSKGLTLYSKVYTSIFKK
jgi:glycosyltransferase involved in cell wall biosynthesis